LLGPAGRADEFRRRFPPLAAAEGDLLAAAGDPQCVFKTSVTDLKRLTGGIVSYNVAEPLEGETEEPPMPRTKTFTGERKVPGVEAGE
jgi:hypothetical protein